ncbi:MAG: alkaline phosphatase family protein [Bacteroidales bacterium]|nr:alkaline phosphatase family protein [Bacteroidales bacterium]
MKISNFLIIILIQFFASTISAQPTATKHVILIGIDGVSAESFQYSNTPVINNLIRQGVISLKTRGVMPSVSAPNWATLLSGAGPEQHGITTNNWSLLNQGYDPTVKDADGYFPSIFTIIHKQMPKAVTAMFYDWKWLGTYVNKKYISKEQFVEGHVMITSVAMNYFKKEKPLFTFIYYGRTDETSQSKGFTTKEYYQDINDIDTEIGKIVDEIKEAGMGKNTTIIITSDHGSVGLGHGSESTVEIEVPWIISGPGIKKNIILESPNDQANTAPTIAKILGLKTPPEWIGKPVNDVFVSKTAGEKPKQYIPKPFCSLADGAFPGPQQIELTTTGNNCKIYYTLDGTSPGITSRKYTSPFTISDNCTLKAVCISGNMLSQPITRMYTFVQGIKSADLTSRPSPRYPGAGVSGLFDGLIGSSHQTNKQWMGFESADFEVTVDLGEVKPVNAMGIDVLQFPANSILIPAAIEFYVSNDGIIYSLLDTYYPAETDETRLDGPVMLSKAFDNLRTQYIRIKAINTGTCPPALPCEGQKAWILVSEVEIE